MAAQVFQRRVDQDFRYFGHLTPRQVSMRHEPRCAERFPNSYPLFMHTRFPSVRLNPPGDLAGAGQRFTV